MAETASHGEGGEAGEGVRRCLSKGSVGVPPAGRAGRGWCLEEVHEGWWVECLEVEVEVEVAVAVAEGG